MKRQSHAFRKGAHLFIGLALSSVLVAIQGCGISAYVSDNYVNVAQQVPYRAEQPIAREIRFVYADGSIVSGVGGRTNFLFATNLQSTEAVKQHGISYIKQHYPDVEEKDFISTSKLADRIYFQDSNLAAKGRAALDKQSSGQDLTINEAAATQTLGLSRSIDNSVGLMNASLATMDALGNWARKEHEHDGYELINWVSDNTGAIGASAEKGSVLYLDFIHVLQGESFQFSSESDIIVTATLERPDKEMLRSTQAIHMSIYSGGTPSAEQVRNKLVYKQSAAHLTQKPQMQPMKSVSYGMELAALANAAIKDLYQQLK